MRIVKQYRFEAAHRLPYHNGKCAREHGHSYVLEIAVDGQVKPDNGKSDSGMVMDFADVSAVAKPMVEKYLDHHRLNDSLQLENPTAENIVLWIVAHLQSRLDGLSVVRLWETSTAYAEWEFGRD